MKYIAMSGEIIEAEPPSKGELHKLKVLGKMHFRHGVNPDRKTCGECFYLGSRGFNHKRYFKCLKYGSSMSEATDWRKSWQACGAFRDTDPEVA